WCRQAWDAFAVPEAPTMAVVFTICDNAAHEACPVWPDQPRSAHCHPDGDPPRANPPPVHGGRPWGSRNFKVGLNVSP
ncbi:MAG TPA: hypothetical protein VES89_04580, partial [Candidatus Competibacteraceae bacterium]|nr:hypothetical protein [Candidatus Competibacteraceae bacterium]